jgi:peptidoglycan glycosyltransferase
MGRRIRWLAAVLILCFTLVLLQLFNVQFRRANALANSPHNPRIAEQQYDQPRGTILASDGTTVLAQSVASHVGVYKYQRQYPQKDLFAQIVGYDSLKYGTSGVEQQYDQYLTQHKQPTKTLNQLLNPTYSTDDVTLTVSPSLQAVAQQQLAGRDGAVVVLDPNSGAVEAMYSNPTFDPNGMASPYSHTEDATRYAELLPDAEGFSAANPLATRHTFAPGSTFKVVTSSAVYDDSPALASKSYPYTQCFTFAHTNVPLCNDSGEQCGGTLAIMLPASCDTGYAMVGVDLGAATLSKQATQFGFNQTPPFDVPGTLASQFPTSEVINPVDQALLAQSAIGQFDVRATAFQMALVAAGIANGGVVMTPHVMAQIHDGQGNLVQSYQQAPWLRATTQQTAAQVNQLMQGVVTNGTATSVGFLPQDQVAAKTGTAQTGNSANNTHDWMIAFAPASHPKVAVAVVVPFQAKSAYGATVAGPIVRAMIEAALGTASGTQSTGGA